MTPQEKRAHEYAKRASLCPREFDARFEGYLQAEKDLALTWEDIKLIHELSEDVWEPNCDDQNCYEEVLRRFNETKTNKFKSL